MIPAALEGGDDEQTYRIGGDAVTYALMTYYQFDAETILLDKLLDSGLLGVAMLLCVMGVLFMIWMLRSQRDSRSLITAVQDQTAVMKEEQEQRKKELAQREAETQVNRELVKEVGAAKTSILDTHTNLNKIRRSIMKQDNDRSQRFKGIEDVLGTHGLRLERVEKLITEVRDAFKTQPSGEEIVAKLDAVLQAVCERKLDSGIQPLPAPDASAQVAAATVNVIVPPAEPLALVPKAANEDEGKESA